MERWGFGMDKRMPLNPKSNPFFISSKKDNNVGAWLITLNDWIHTQQSAHGSCIHS